LPRPAKLRRHRAVAAPRCPLKIAGVFTAFTLSVYVSNQPLALVKSAQAAMNSIVDSPPTALPPPGLRRRMACWLYEGVLMFGVVWIAGYLYGALSQTRHALDNRLGLQLFLFVVFGIYFVFFWAKGQTLAMKTWHLRVVDVQGRAISQWRALLRYVLAWLWFLPPLAAATWFKLPAPEAAVIALGWVPVYALLSRFMPQRQWLHDVLAGTRLVSHQPMSRQISP
jgi:uncharacterized RDD family membrane protein YckC